MYRLFKGNNVTWLKQTRKSSICTRNKVSRDPIIRLDLSQFERISAVKRTLKVSDSEQLINWLNRDIENLSAEILKKGRIDHSVPAAFAIRTICMNHINGCNLWWSHVVVVMTQRKVPFGWKDYTRFHTIVCITSHRSLWLGQFKCTCDCNASQIAHLLSVLFNTGTGNNATRTPYILNSIQLLRLHHDRSWKKSQQFSDTNDWNFWWQRIFITRTIVFNFQYINTIIQFVKINKGARIILIVLRNDERIECSCTCYIKCIGAHTWWRFLVVKGKVRRVHSIHYDYCALQSFRLVVRAKDNLAFHSLIGQLLFVIRRHINGNFFLWKQIS